MRTPVVISLVFAAACSRWIPEPEPPSGPGPSGQTYAQAVQVMCDVDQLAEVATDEPDELADIKRFDYLARTVDNPDGIYLRTILSVKFGEDRACLLKEAQQETGIATCALAERSP